MENQSRFKVKLYDFDVSKTRRDVCIESNDPTEILSIVDDCVDNTYMKYGKHFDRVVVYDTVLKRNLLDYFTERYVNSHNLVNS